MFMTLGEAALTRLTAINADEAAKEKEVYESLKKQFED